ncbi:hypothetical protein [Streptomyces sp. NPDC048825]|uniref:hypothetical protein n=1 Tax=Streptomyces sp. NPDC048825 TaxID=3365592 RepID=UPI003711CCDE
MFHHRTGTVLALAYTSLGDHEAARAVAWRQETEEERSETLAALAEYVACLPADLRLTQIRKTPWADILIVRRLAGLLAPPSSGPDIPRARSLLAEALTPDGWHYAAPVLAAIDPDAVLRVRDVVFGYLGLTLSD